MKEKIDRQLLIDYKELLMTNVQLGKGDSVKKAQKNSGNYGKVYKAFHRKEANSNGCEVACKFLNSSNKSDNGFADLMAEATIMKDLRLLCGRSKFL